MKDKSLSTYAHNVKIVTQDGQVTLKGPVRSEDEKKAIEAKATEGAGTKDFAHEKNTKAPEGATTGAGTGALLGGGLGWLLGIGALAIPGLGPFIAAGPSWQLSQGRAWGALLAGSRVP